MLFMIFIAGGRTINVGIDTDAYLEIYNDIRKNGYLLYLEPTWNYLNIFANWLGLSFNGFLILISFLTLYPIFYLSRKLSINHYLPIFIYFALHIFGASLNVMRQYMTISYILVIYYSFSKRQWIWVIIWSVIIISIHKSNILLIPILFILKYINITSLKWIGIGLLGTYILGCVVNDSFFAFFIMDYSSYIDKGLYRDSSIMATIFSCIVGIFSFWLYTLIPKYKRNTIWCKIFILSLFILLLTFRLEYGARIYILCSISQLFFIPYLIKTQSTIKEGDFKLIIYSYYSVVFIRMWLLNANGIMPYHNVWL